MEKTWKGFSQRGLSNFRSTKLKWRQRIPFLVYFFFHIPPDVYTYLTNPSSGPQYNSGIIFNLSVSNEFQNFQIPGIFQKKIIHSLRANPNCSLVSTKWQYSHCQLCHHCFWVFTKSFEDKLSSLLRL